MTTSTRTPAELRQQAIDLLERLGEIDPDAGGRGYSQGMAERIRTNPASVRCDEAYVGRLQMAVDELEAITPPAPIEIAVEELQPGDVLAGSFGACDRIVDGISPTLGGGAYHIVIRNGSSRHGPRPILRAGAKVKIRPRADEPAERPYPDSEPEGLAVDHKAQAEIDGEAEVEIERAEAYIAAEDATSATFRGDWDTDGTTAIYIPRAAGPAFLRSQDWTQDDRGRWVSPSGRGEYWEIDEALSHAITTLANLNR